MYRAGIVISQKNKWLGFFESALAQEVMKLVFLLFTLLGIILNVGGAYIIGLSDRLSDEEIVKIATSTTRLIAPVDNDEVLREYPLAREFMKRRQNSMIGLAIIIIGSLFLIGTSLGSLES